jgi:hypothetical protein
MSVTIKTLTIDEVEDAILQGQEVHARIMADVLAEYYKPLIAFQLAMTQQGGMNEQISGGMGAPDTSGGPADSRSIPQRYTPGQTGGE